MTAMDRPSGSLRRRALLGMAVSAIALSAIGLPDARAQAGGEIVDLTVVDRETGEAARVWRYRDRLFVAGRPGARYGLRVANHTSGRVLVVLSVDGINVLTGETAGYAQRGYVLRPFETYDVNGWRKSDSEVAAFTFAALSQSYAARTGRPGDVGVIGVAAFREREAPYVESRRSAPPSEVDEVVVTGARAPASAAPAPPPAMARAAPPPTEEKLGTAHGAREWSTVTAVRFERATPYPQLVRRIEYDSYPNLVAAGVIRPLAGVSPRPRPFPSGGGYVPDPPRWP